MSYRLNQIFFLSILIFLLLSTVIQGKVGGEYYEGEATIPIVNITPEQARSKAFQLARDQALFAAGVELSVATGRKVEEDPTGFYDRFVRYTGSRAIGLIVEENTLIDRQAIQNLGLECQLVHEVKIRALIKPTLSQPDPGFQLEMAVDRESYRNGESLVISLQATRDCYVTLFNLYSNDSLLVIAPNQYLPEISLHKNVGMTIPPSNANWDFPLSLTLGDTLAYEGLFAVATKTNIPFPGMEAKEREGLLSFGDALLRLNRWLIAIPLDQRADAWEFYRIVK